MSEDKCFSRAVTAEVVVGLFVSVVFITLAVFTIVISGSGFFSSEKYPIRIAFDNAMGLRRNDPVIARGTPVGVVNDVYYEKEQVYVEAVLNRPIEFREGYNATVQSTSILGGRQLVLDEGPPGAAVVEDVLGLVGDKPSDLMEDAGAVVKAVREFLQGDFLDNLDDIGKNIAAMVARVEQGEGTLGKLLSSDTEVYDDLRGLLANLNSISGRLEAGEGTLGKLLSADSKVFDDLSDMMANLKSISGRLEAGEGTLGKLLSSDSKMYDDLSETMAKIRSISGRLEAGEGTLGKLLSSDTEVYDDLRDLVANLKTISQRLEAGEGTLGKLFSSDSELYDNVNSAVLDVREVIDDLREASPVSTFSTFIFGAF